MKVTLEVTGKLFDFTEATLFVHFPGNLPNMINIEAWGITLIVSGLRDTLSNVGEFENIKDDIYIAGFSKITFSEELSGVIEVTPYNNHEGTGFVKTDNRKSLVLQRNWGSEVLHDECQYHLGGVIDWPYGYAQLGINTDGSVFIEFETNACISAKEYVFNAAKYTYQRK